MNNPITNDVFDTRDLIEYKEYLEEEMIDFYNDFVEQFNEDEENEELEEITSFSEVDFENDDFLDQYNYDIEDYRNIESFCEDLESSPDFTYGESVIHEDYFTEYAEAFVKSCGYIDYNLPYWIENNIDWDGVADEIKQDYMKIDFEGESYFIRA